MGQAYKEALPYVKGKYVIIGDADCTYNFRDLTPFLDKLNLGYEFVMGSRFKGNIEKGSMPYHHRYFGTPLTSWILTKTLQLPFTDIHCGMRSMTRKLLLSLPFDEPGWEYAPEMIAQACKITDKYCEVPVDFYREPSGRVSHFRRGRFAFFAPFKAGIGAIRVTCMHGLDKLLNKLGVWLGILGSTLAISLTFNSITIFSFRFSSVTQYLGCILGILGTFFYLISNLMKDLYNQRLGTAKIHKKIFFLFINLAFLCLFGLCASTYLVIKFFDNEKQFLYLLTNFQHLIITYLYICSLSVIYSIFAIVQNYLSLPSNLTKKISNH